LEPIVLGIHHFKKPQNTSKYKSVKINHSQVHVAALQEYQSPSIGDSD